MEGAPNPAGAGNGIDYRGKAALLALPRRPVLHIDVTFEEVFADATDRNADLTATHAPAFLANISRKSSSTAFRTDYAIYESAFAPKQKFTAAGGCVYQKL